MGNVGMPELIIIVLLIVIFFGSKKIPELAAGLGKGMREFRKATRDIQQDQEEESVHELKAPRTDTMACVYCNSRVAKDARFCPSCGKSLESPRCPKCQKINSLGARFCVECGEKF